MLIGLTIVICKFFTPFLYFDQL